MLGRLFWPQFRWWDSHQFRHKHQHNRTKSDLAKKPQSQDASKGPLQIIVSIADQRIRCTKTVHLLHVPRSQGVQGRCQRLLAAPPAAQLGKEKWQLLKHLQRCTYSYMQRITWSGIALHAGDLPGYPASHGCIRLTKEFAIRLWHLTKRGTRVIIAHDDIRPVEASNPNLFQPKSDVTSNPAGFWSCRTRR